jgi:hypothetical protein
LYIIIYNKVRYFFKYKRKTLKVITVNAPFFNMLETRAGEWRGHGSPHAADHVGAHVLPVPAKWRSI